MATSSRAAVLLAERRIENQQIQVPTPGPDELLVRVLATGICGSDLAAYRGTHPYKQPPVVLGHELCGEVVMAGSRAQAWLGQRVCSAAFSPCERCVSCTGGSTHLCRNRRNLGHGDWSGSFAEYVLLQRNMVFAVPDQVTSETGAMVEPLSIAHHAVQLTDVVARSVCIVGAGGIGLSCVLVARRLGATRVTCVDIGPDKAALASAVGADHYVDASLPFNTPGELADVTVVATGHVTALDDARALTRPGGQVVVVSYFAARTSIDFNPWVATEMTVHFSALSTPTDFAAIIGWIADASLDPSPLITHRFGMDETKQALKVLDAGGNTGKIMLTTTKHEAKNTDDVI